MSNSYFDFKKFRVRHDRCAQKVGTDGALLGAWAALPGGQQPNILDVGTGSGLIALMMAQRCPIASVTALDIEEAS
ncbi:MAG: methyltransferase, partial [Bacteroidales bacterium]|nr:methyltransferase [Candidatus Physcousia equi]